MQKENKINVDNAKYDSCGVRIIAASDMPVSLWSGGRTTEIYICLLYTSDAADEL